MNDSMIELCETFQAWLQQQEQVVNLDSYTLESLQCWKIPIYYDDEESSTPLRDIIISELPPCIAITPVLSTEKPVDSLIMEDEHLDTIPATKSNEIVSDSNDDSTLIDDDSFSIDDIDYVKASPPHSDLKILEEIEALNANPTPSFDFVLVSPIPVEDGDSFLEKFETTPKLETFKFDIEEKNNGSTTIHTDISLPDLECFYFKREPDPGDLTSIIDPGIRKNVSFTTNVNLPFEDDQSPLFAYVVWIFLPFLTYPIAPPYLLSSGNEDTIFDLGISIYHSFMPGVSHRSGTFMKFNVYLNYLNESPMEILSSTCFPMDQ
nr:hypothetical protein [Tanacetum cinerariifolium]